jgi:AcrR family transcriptional regulator
MSPTAAPRPVRSSRSTLPEPLARRDQLLEAALAVISQKGFHQTSMADIGRRAGVSRATVYLHFRDRRDILVALADRIARRVIDAVGAWPALPMPQPGATGTEGVWAEADTLRAMIKARISQILETIIQNADAARLVLRVTRGSDSIVDNVLRRIDVHVVAVLAADIETAIAFGWARPCHANTVARFILGGIERLTVGALDRDETLDVETLAHEVTAFVSGGLYNPAHFPVPRPDDPVTRKEGRR